MKTIFLIQILLLIPFIGVTDTIKKTKSNHKTQRFKDTISLPLVYTDNGGGSLSIPVGLDYNGKPTDFGNSQFDDPMTSSEAIKSGDYLRYREERRNAFMKKYVGIPFVIVIIALLIFWWYKFEKNKSKFQENSNLFSLKEEFTKRQKIAIMRVLYSIIETGNTHPEEKKYFRDTANYLSIQLASPEMADEITFNGIDEIIKGLNTLNPYQKTQFIIIVHEMLTINNRIESKLQFVLDVCRNIGITKEMYSITIKKTQAIQSKLFS